MTHNRDMFGSVRAFEAACHEAGVHPLEAFAAAELHRATWFRWKAMKSSPTIRSLERAFTGLEIIKTAPRSRSGGA